MQHSEHKRHQHRYLPGEVTRQFKTAMREKRGLVKTWKKMWGKLVLRDKEDLDPQAKSYRTALKWRNNSRQRQRDKEIAMQKDEPKYEPTEDAPGKEDFERELDDDKEAFKERWLPQDPEPSQN
jgi:hypothetical protein